MLRNALVKFGRFPESPRSRKMRQASPAPAFLCWIRRERTGESDGIDGSVKVKQRILETHLACIHMASCVGHVARTCFDHFEASPCECRHMMVSSCFIKFRLS